MSATVTQSPFGIDFPFPIGCRFPQGGYFGLITAAVAGYATKLQGE
jgi:hypothetical protein